MIAGATNDNLVKTAFVIAITALSWDLFGLNPVVLANIAALCFILPFIFFAGLAAFKANKQPPKKWLFILKLMELALASIACFAIVNKIGWVLLICVAGFGIQSAFIGPLKYALIPRLSDRDEILDRNAWMETATFISILAGTLLAANWIVSSPHLLILLIIILAVIGCLGILLLPTLKGRSESVQQSLIELINRQRKDQRSMSAIWCLSGFWAVGSVWLTHLPILATDIWHLAPQSVGKLLGYFVLGITFGVIGGVLLKQQGLVRRILLGAFAMVIGSLLIQISNYTIASTGLVLTSAGGGFLALPLYTLLQDDLTAVADRIAVNNIANAYMIIIAAIASMLTVGLLGLPLVIWLLTLSVGQLLLCLYHRSNLSFS
ncbi:MAG: hypothetical protein CMD99_06035 [Gammaproteobacteria bacterium]|nr:hypothetical protein [Gammaproteobacteria bacterium]